jgi:predicted nucleic-acid-binding protein
MNPERTFIDTNLFLRYLTNDLPAQADAVEGLLRQAASGEILLVTNCMVIAELVWTLESFYKLAPGVIQDQLFATLNTPGLEVEDSDILFQALLWYVEKKVDFIDAYNVAWMQSRAIQTAFTFDRKHFSRFEGLSVRTPGQISDH